MYKTRNGWTKAKMIEAIQTGNNGTQSLNGEYNEFCAYRGTNRNKCAAGCFISDEDYKTSFEKKSANTLPQPIINKFPISLNGMMELQKEHDEPTGESSDIRSSLINWIENNVEDSIVDEDKK